MVFFKYCTDKSKRQLVNQILEQEEGIAMAAQTLLTISRDEVERAQLLSEYKFAVDYQSGMVNARREGLAEGRVEGCFEERQNTVRRMRAKGMDDVAIAELLGYPLDEVMRH